MVDFFMNLPVAMQIFCFVAMLIGLYVMYKFKYLVGVIAGGTLAIFLALKNKNNK